MFLLMCSRLFWLWNMTNLAHLRGVWAARPTRRCHRQEVSCINLFYLCTSLLTIAYDKFGAPTRCIKPVSPLNRAKSRKIGHFQTFEVWTFVPAIFWFLVVCMVKMWSDRKKSNRKDSWYQYYSVLLTSAPPSCHRQPSAFVPQPAPNIWTQAESILVQRTINQNIEVLLFWKFPWNLDYFW